MSPLFATLPKFTICYFVYFTTDLGNDSFELPFPIWWVLLSLINSCWINPIILLTTVDRFPFNSKNHIGYFIACSLQYIIIGYELYVIACIFSLAIGGYMIGISGTKEIKNVLHSINGITKTSGDKKYLFQQICLFIFAHSIVKQLIIKDLIFFLFETSKIDWINEITIEIFWNVILEWHISFLIYFNPFLWFFLPGVL